MSEINQTEVDAVMVGLARARSSELAAREARDRLIARLARDGNGHRAIAAALRASIDRLPQLAPDLPAMADHDLGTSESAVRLACRVENAAGRQAALIQ
jgi:hypothetical protein